MPPKVQHDIDPDPDTVIILKNPLIKFAIWEGEQVPSYKEPPSPLCAPEPDIEPLKPNSDFWAPPTTTRTFKKSENRMTVTWDEEEPNHNLNRTAPAENDTAEPSDSNQGLHVGLEIETTGKILPTDSSQEHHPSDLSTEPAEEEGIYYYVSSRHLKSASAQFRRMMTGGKWKEGIREDNGLFHITTTEWDAEAFLIFMNVLHLRNRRVPRVMTLEMIAKVAVLVDFYECQEAIEAFSTIWIAYTKRLKQIPTVYGRDLIMWICITQTFGLAAQFKNATETALRQSKEESIQTLELPIRHNIVFEMQQHRCQALERTVASLYDLLDKYRNWGYVCPHNSSRSLTCGSALFGGLTKQLEFLELLPRPEVPFLGCSIESIHRRICLIQSPAWLDNRHENRHSCDLKTSVMASLKTATKDIHGLNLGDFQVLANESKDRK